MACFSYIINELAFYCYYSRTSHFLLKIEFIAPPLTQTRHFAILDRDYIDERKQEFAVLLSDDAKKEDSVRIGNTLGADYLLVGTVSDFSVNVATEKTAYLNEKSTIARGSASIAWRLVEVATGMVVAASTYDTKFAEGISNDGDTLWVSKLGRPAGTEIATRITDIIYPILVIRGNDQHLILSRGGEFIKVGQQFNLIKYGDLITDPYTKETSARDEEIVGLVEISAVAPKSSRAKILRADTDLSQIGLREYILRPVANTKQTGNRQGTAVQTLQPKW